MVDEKEVRLMSEMYDGGYKDGIAACFRMMRFMLAISKEKTPAEVEKLVSEAIVGYVDN